jgi:hypothetical protein
MDIAISQHGDTHVEDLFTSSALNQEEDLAFVWMILKYTACARGKLSRKSQKFCPGARLGDTD